MSGYCEDVTEEKSSADASTSAQSVQGVLGAATTHLAETLCPGQPTVPEMSSVSRLQAAVPQIQLDKLAPVPSECEAPSVQSAAEGALDAIKTGFFGSSTPSLSLSQEKSALPAIGEECKVPSAESAAQGAATFSGLFGASQQLASGKLPTDCKTPSPQSAVEGMLGSISSGFFGTSNILSGAPALPAVSEECKAPSKSETSGFFSALSSGAPVLPDVSQALCSDKSALPTVTGNLSAASFLPSGLLGSVVPTSASGALQALQQPCKSPLPAVPGPCQPEDPPSQSQFSDLEALLRGGTEGNDLMSSARNSLYKIASPNLPGSSLAQNPASSQTIALQMCGRAASGNKWLFIVFQLFNVFLVLSSAGQVVASTFMMLSAGEVLWSNVSFIVTGAVSTVMGMLGPLTRSRDTVLLVYNTILTLESGVQTGMSIAGAVCESYKHQVDSNDLAELYKYGMLLISTLQFCTALFGWVYRCSLRASQLLSASIASLPYSPFK